jgi:hypothetical protein
MKSVGFLRMIRRPIHREEKANQLSGGNTRKLKEFLRKPNQSLLRKTLNVNQS